ncbi:MAG TPA: hypothetical protein GX505_06805 [Clostridiales bacterium]|nr:hypothetical protein [Clostridiales bacterium]
MGFLDVERITSSSDTQVDAVSRQNAVLKAINKENGDDPIQDAVVLGNMPHGIWPILEPYKTDPSFASTLALPPDFIWDSTEASPGEVRYFAVARPIDTADSVTIFILTFSDDAHRLYVEECDANGNVVQSITPDNDGLIDSPLEPILGRQHFPTTGSVFVIGLQALPPCWKKASW